jgi:hypothetical protein
MVSLSSDHKDEADVHTVVCFAPSCSVPIALRAIPVQTFQTLDANQAYTLIGACYLGNYKDRRNKTQYLGQPHLRGLALVPVALCREVHEDISHSAGSTSLVKQVPPSTEEEEVSVKTSQLRPTNLTMKGYRMRWICVSNFLVPSSPRPTIYKY